MHEYEVAYNAVTPSGTIIERGLIQSSYPTIELMAVSILQTGGFKNVLTGKFVFVCAVLQITQLT